MLKPTESEDRRTRVLRLCLEIRTKRNFSCIKILNKTTTVDTHLYVPVSPEGAAIRDRVRRPLMYRRPIGYQREFLQTYQPDSSADLPAIAYSVDENADARICKLCQFKYRRIYSSLVLKPFEACLNLIFTLYIVFSLSANRLLATH